MTSLSKFSGRVPARAACGALCAMALAVTLSGCATSADPGQMTVATQTTDKPFPQRFQHAMCVRTVSGGEETNPLWVSKVDDKGFSTALTTSLESAGLEAPRRPADFPSTPICSGFRNPRWVST